MDKRLFDRLNNTNLSGNIPDNEKVKVIYIVLIGLVYSASPNPFNPLPFVELQYQFSSYE